MQSLTRTGMGQIRSAVEAALVNVGEHLGVGLTLEGGRFSAKEGHFKLVATVLSESGEVQTPERMAWKTVATAYGFQVDDLDKVFRVGGKAYKISGIKPSRSQYPISADRVPDGKGFKFPTAEVLRALGREVPEGLEFTRRRRRGFGYFED